MSEHTGGGLPSDIGLASTQQPVGSGGGEYEFDQGQNTVFKELSDAMAVVGLGTLIIGGLCVLVALGEVASGQGAEAFGSLCQAVMFIATGIWSRRASVAIGRIVSSSGSDITLLMSAMGELRSIYRMQATFLKVFGVLFAIGVLVGLLAALGGAKG